MMAQKDITKIALMAQQIDYIVESIDELKGNYVSKQEFDPIKRLVYGGVGLILVGVLGALLSVVVK